ncbi:MAG TPA: GNAT family N-acetyltransferase [Pseudonocardiaceae bacterium]|nr:GNAT family N-acetyltransferase [Pseudonocardiaceae bacterium]
MGRYRRSIGGIFSSMVSEILIRPAWAADVPGIIALFTAIAEERDGIGAEPGFDVAERRSRILGRIEDDASCVLVATLGDNVVGNLGVHPRHNVGSLAMMLARQHRGQGIGGRLLDEGLRWARESQLHKVDLGVWPHNTAAIALYRSRSFAVEGRLRRHYRRANGELWDMVAMGLVLDTRSPGSSLPDAKIL